jgi:aminoglycoside 6'-N-acetyltransferase I
VVEPLRRTGIGAQLVRTAEEWARAQGCTEMASDTWLDNTLSQQAHAALGYEEVERLVHFRKSLQ